MEKATLLAAAAVLMLVPAPAASTASQFEMFPPPRADEFPNRVAAEVSKSEPAQVSKPEPVEVPKSDPVEVGAADEAADAGTDSGRAAADGAEVLRTWAERLAEPPSRPPAPPATRVVGVPGTGEGLRE